MLGVEELGDAYERAEAAYLDGLRSRHGHEVLAGLATAVAHAAVAWNEAAYRAFHESADDRRADLDALSERTEVLSELWVDVAKAYAG